METKDTNYVPLDTQLKDVYQDINGSLKAVHEPRYKNIRDRFKSLYGDVPKFFARAPGRVNIIGEHIDYCGYAVLPAAIEQDFVMAYTINDSTNIVINNMDKDQFPGETIDCDPNQKFKEGNHWLNYFLCGMKAILSLDEQLASSVTKYRGLNILIDSHVPPAAGLSSSSAFTVCAALVMLHVYDLQNQIPKDKLSKLCITAERKAGTACGGMDQTISIMGEMNKAKIIDFNPKLKATDVEIPTSVLLVIANSLAPSPKLATLYKRYNMRVVECRLALVILAVKLGKADSPSKVPYKTFYELQQDLGESFDKMIEHSMTLLKKGGYTQDQIKKELNIGDVHQLISDIAYSFEVLQYNASFALQERAMHVFSEAKRVHEFRATCEDQTLPEEDKVQKLGKLMNTSHESCNKLYDCSCPELEELTQMCRDNGALGSRLTGAGWGGCCVSLIKKENKDQFIEKIQDYYLKQRETGNQLWVTDDLNRYLFASVPAKGASTSSYLRYIQKFRHNPNSKNASEETSFNKENYSLATSSDQTSISESNLYKRKEIQTKEKPIKPFVNTQEDKRTTVDTKDNQVLNQTFSYNIDKEDQFSFNSQRELKDQLRSLQKRLEKEEDQSRETIKVLKLLQQQSDHQEVENEQFRIYYSDLKTRVFTLEQKCQNNQINLSDLQEKPKALLEKDIKELGKEMAMDILKLSKKMDSKEHNMKKKFEQMEQEVKKTKEKLYKLLEKERKKTSQQKVAEIKPLYPSNKMNEEKQKQIQETYGDIMKKLENLSREVHLQSKKPIKRHSSKYGTNETDLEYNNKENKIMEKINQLESDLNKIKGNSFLTQNSNNYNQLSLSADFGTLSPENNSFVKKGPSFSKNNQDQYTNPASEGRSLSKSAQRLQNSLEKRMSEFGENRIPKRQHPAERISKRESRRPYKDVMNISFSSTSSDYYYETGKSQLQDLQSRQRVKSGSKSKSKSKHRSTAKKVNSAHRKSFDDFIRVEVRKKTQTQRHTRKPSQNRDFNLTTMAQRKELEMLDRAKRMVNLASLNILQQEIRRRSASASLRKKKAPSRKKSQQNQGNNFLLYNIKQSLKQPNILPQTLKDPLLKVSMSSNLKDNYFRKTMM